MTPGTLAKPILALALLAGLSGCGLQGDLTRPDPLFGDPGERGEAGLPSRSVDTGLQNSDPLGDFDETGDVEGNEDEPPNAEDELLGGPEG
jgi:predicted small lipoprotein YifL